MTRFCNDVDISRYESILYSRPCPAGQVLAKGTSAQIFGGTLTDNSANFEQSGITAGHVIYIRSLDGNIDGIFEITGFKSTTELNLSLIRADGDTNQVYPVDNDNVEYQIATLEPLIAEAGFRLSEYLGLKPGLPWAKYHTDQIIESGSLKRASVYLVISAAYAILANNSGDKDMWSRSLHYQKLFEKARQRCRVNIDTNGDGVGDISLQTGAPRLHRD